MKDIDDSMEFYINYSYITLSFEWITRKIFFCSVANNTLRCIFISLLFFNLTHWIEKESRNILVCSRTCIFYLTRCKKKAELEKRSLGNPLDDASYIFRVSIRESPCAMHRTRLSLYCVTFPRSIERGNSTSKEK